MSGSKNINVSEVLGYYIMNKTGISLASFVLLCLLGAQTANAAQPIAPRVPVTKEGKLINYDWKGTCPPQSEVGVPAYPGSLCTKAAMFNKHSGFVELISGTSAAAVVSWYSGHLSGWRHTKVMSGDVIFVPPGVDLNRVYPGYSDTNITIHKLTAGGVKLKKMIYAFQGTPKTLITIDYEVNGGMR